MADRPFDSISLDATFFCGSSAVALRCQITGCPVWADFCFKLSQRAARGSNTTLVRKQVKPLFSIQFTNRFKYLEVPKGDFRSPKWCQMSWLSFIISFVSPFFSAWRWRMWPDSKGRNIAFTPNSRAPRIWWNGSASGKINTGIKLWNREIWLISSKCYQLWFK